MGDLMILVTKPFCVIKLLCISCVKTIVIVVNTWVELMLAGISLNISIFCRAVLWTFALVTLPIRLLTAVQRERKLEARLRYTQVESEYLLWYQMELEGRLQKAIRERGVMELVLSELEEEHEKTISRLELLEHELRALKVENLRLKEIQGMDVRSFKSQPSQVKPWAISKALNHGNIPFGISSLKTPRDGPHGSFLQELLSEKKNMDALLSLLNDSNPNDSKYIMGLELETSEFLDQQREVALKQSLFSAILSFLVGMIVWEAKDPCMPLVVALFTVVGMSLRSVVQFFSTLSNKPASDAVALLSLNWFILGTLTYPTLPKVARMLNPILMSLLGRMMR